MSDFVDIRMRSFVQRYLDENYKHDQKLKSLRLCGRSSFSLTNGKFGGKKNVYIMSNGEKAVAMGTRTCRKSFGCPCCTPRIMAQYGTNIACAIDAMKKWYNQNAFMITFTLPHSCKMNSTMAMQILKNTWRLFIKDKCNRTRGYTKKDGSSSQYSISKNPCAKFRNDLGIDMYIRVYEMTWSKQNGWHYHIHALMWAPKKNWNKILQYEDMINDYWWKCAKIEATKFLNKIRPENKLNNALEVEKFYTDWRKNPVTGHRCVYISQENGKPVVQKSSFYITGWTGDVELASGSHRKTAREGHYNIRQILEAAYENRDNENLKNQFLSLYVESIKTIYRQKIIDTTKIKFHGIFLKQTERKGK